MNTATEIELRNLSAVEQWDASLLSPYSRLHVIFGLPQAYACGYTLSPYSRLVTCAIADQEVFDWSG